jgi:putative hydrolase of the HAD superfamily
VIKALLIDLDGVIRHWSADDPGFLDRFGVCLAEIKRTAFSESLLLPAITGQITDEEWRKKIALQLLSDGFYRAEEAVSAWSEGAGGVDHRLLARVQSLRHKLKVVLVTNATTRLEKDLAALGLSESFDEVINSSRVGFAKPSQEVFQAALDCVGVEAAGALFVDDTLANVTAAQALGIASHHFQGLEGFDSCVIQKGFQPVFLPID